MHVLLYTYSTCSFCARAKELLAHHGVAYDEEVLDGNRKMIERLAALFDRKTMPYVMIDGDPIGGLAELEQLAREGRLAESGD